MDYLKEVIDALRDAERFVRVTFSGPDKAPEAAWQRVTVRSVEIGGERMLQAVFQGERKQVARNFSPDEAEAHVREFAGMGFRHVDLQRTDRDMHVRITRRGKALVSRGRPSAAAQATLQHNREKDYPFPADVPDDFLDVIGVMRRGRVLPTMQDKFRQINHFLMLLGHTALFRRGVERPVHLVDCGCGRAFLTLAAFHYLRDRKEIPVRVTGIDANAEVIAHAETMRGRLGYDNVEFIQSRIADYRPEAPPQVVLSLHACDTATDEALALGVQWGTELILSAPCCQHELHTQIKHADFRAVLRHGILRERLADVLTDALRAAALRVMGYRTDVIEFISPGHTAKNLMIRAERVREGAVGDAAAEYLRLRDFWQVRPAIEQLLGEPFQKALQG